MIEEIAKEFIILHTKEKNFNLENYIPEGQLEGFPKEIIARMLECQVEQENKRDISVFEENRTSYCQGFIWDKSKEGYDFWDEVIRYKHFDLFFKKYPKKEDNQEFRIEDKVYDIILGEIGIVKKIIGNDPSSFPIAVVFENCGTVLYTLEGKFLARDKYPRLLHYRDDYNYDVIEFNNLPKRQEANRWRAEVGQRYYYFNTYFEVDSFIEEGHNTDTKLYNLGDYFQTKEQAQEVADKLNTYFKQLIKEEHANNKTSRK